MSDKEMEVVDLDQLFERYVETDFLGHYDDSTADRSSSDDLAHLFEPSSSNESDWFGSGSTLDREAEAAWHKAVEKCKQNPASNAAHDSSSFCLESTGKGSLSDSELLNFEDLLKFECNQLRSRSQPSTPRPHTTRSVKKAVSFNNRSIANGIQKPVGKFTAKEFAKMMQPSQYRATMPDWTRRMDTPADSLYLRAPMDGIKSPPIALKTSHENGNGFFGQDHQPYTASRSPVRNNSHQISDQEFVNYQLTPQASPGIGFPRSDEGVGLSDTLGMSFSSSVSSAARSALQTPPSSLQLPMTTWGPDTSPGLDFTFSTSPDYSAASKTAGWWNDDVSAQPTLYRESTSRSTSQANMVGTTGALNGLGISCDATPFGDFNAAMGGSVGENMRGASASSFDMGSYTAMHPTPPAHHMVPIGHRPLSRTPSPCPQPRFHRRRPSSHAHPSQSHHRAPSSRRKSSTNSSQTLSRQSSSGNVGFVNFTPDDSRKILTGVAPSGSSKTKARREKEAADKRRKLSQAAMKAVIEAGGDVDSLKRLEREGLLVLES